MSKGCHVWFWLKKIHPFKLKNFLLHISFIKKSIGQIITFPLWKWKIYNYICKLAKVENHLGDYFLLIDRYIWWWDLKLIEWKERFVCWTQLHFCKFVELLTFKKFTNWSTWYKSRWDYVYHCLVHKLIF